MITIPIDRCNVARRNAKRERSFKITIRGDHEEKIRGFQMFRQCTLFPRNVYSYRNGYRGRGNWILAMFTTLGIQKGSLSRIIINARIVVPLEV